LLTSIGETISSCGVEADTLLGESTGAGKRESVASATTLEGEAARIAGGVDSAAGCELGTNFSPGAKMPGIGGKGFSRGRSSNSETLAGCSCCAIQLAISCCWPAGGSLKQMPISFCVAPCQIISPTRVTSSPEPRRRTFKVEFILAVSFLAAWQATPPIPRLMMIPPLSGPR